MSSTATSRLGIIKPTPGTGEPVNLQTQINDSWDKVDAAISSTVCTSGTRPSVPFDGQIIRETDTRRVYIWNATQSAWDEIASHDLLTADWVPFTPVWSAATTPVSIGNGSILGRYKKIDRLVTIVIRLTWGSTTTGGTGEWRIDGLPFDRAMTNNFMPTMCYDSSAVMPYPANALMNASGSQNIPRIGAHGSTGTVGLVAATHPFTWATNDVLAIQGTYQSSS